uniref:Uncharacterized protein n=1 Tax=Strigamia maritima TaxID=126957 RepID=T1IS91_STRMM
MTPSKIIAMFSIAFGLATVVGILVQIKQLDPLPDSNRDCEICGPRLDEKIPMLLIYLKLLAASEMPVSGLCSSCKVSFDGEHMRRVGNYCVIWKSDGSRVVNTFELLIPKVTLTCECNSVLNGKMSSHNSLYEKFPCLNTLHSAITAMETVNDLSIEALEICQSMIMAPFNTTKPIRAPKAKLKVVIENFRLHTEARLDTQLNVINIIARLSHMSPDNFKVFCDIAPPYNRMCDCLETENVRELIYYFMEATLPCMFGFLSNYFLLLSQIKMDGAGGDEFEVVDSKFDHQFSKLRQEVKDLRNQCFPQASEANRAFVQPVKRLLNFSVFLLLVLMTLPVMFVFFLLQFRWILHCPSLPVEAVDNEGKPSDMVACELVLKSASPTLGYFLNCLIMLMSIGITNLIVCSFLYIWSALLAFNKGSPKLGWKEFINPLKSEEDDAEENEKVTDDINSAD